MAPACWRRSGRKKASDTFGFSISDLELQIVDLVAWIVALVVAALALWWLSARLRQRAGLPQGRVIYSDAGAWRRNEQALCAARYRLVGKPDYLVRAGADDAIIPVEVKSGLAPAQPREGHVLQLAAYCLLVEETQGVRPAYGIIQYADRQFAVHYTPRLRAWLLECLEAMRRDAALPQGPTRNHEAPARCATCSVRAACDQRLA